MQYKYSTSSSSSSIGTTTLSWVSACSTVIEHSEQEGFTECRCQRHVKPQTWRRTRDLERSNFCHKRPPASEATLVNLTAEGGTVGEKMAEKFCRKWWLPRHFWVLLHAVSATWDRRLYFPSKGRRAEDFFARKIGRLRPGLNLRTWVPKASTLPLDHQSCINIALITIMYISTKHVSVWDPITHLE
jgi:hypothetical protein